MLWSLIALRSVLSQRLFSLCFRAQLYVNTTYIKIVEKLLTDFVFLLGRVRLCEEWTRRLRLHVRTSGVDENPQFRYPHPLSPDSDPPDRLKKTTERKQSTEALQISRYIKYSEITFRNYQRP